MKYRMKPIRVDVHQWLKNGDHPLDYARIYEVFENGAIRSFTGEERKRNNWEGDVVRYYRHPEIDGDQICLRCKNAMHDHGWIDQGPHGIAVCPGSYVVTNEAGNHSVIGQNALDYYFDPVDPIIHHPV